MEGIWPILYAYFMSNGELDRDAMRTQVRAATATGAPGGAVLGLATEVNKLRPDEKVRLIEWVADDIVAPARLAVTVSGATVADQVALARAAIAAGARDLILQPPAGAPGHRDGDQLEAFFAAVLRAIADAAPDVAVGLQNAPEFLGVGLAVPALLRLRTSCPNFRFLKGEAPAVIIAQTIAALGPDFPVLNGRGGMELPDNLRAGCRGMIVAPDCAAEQQAIAAAFAAGDLARAERDYACILPAIAFVMQSLDTLVVYGKRIAAWRMGFDVVHDRDCAMAPTAFGLRAAARYAAALGPLPGCQLRLPAV